MRIQPATDPIALDDDLVIAGENVDVLAALPEGFFDLIYMDPPFNTGRAQARHTLSVVEDRIAGDRVGFGGRRYRSRLLRTLSAMTTRSMTTWRFSKCGWRGRASCWLPTGRCTSTSTTARRTTSSCCSTSCSAATRSSTSCIWSYDYGAKPRRRWPAKHDTILVYVRTPGGHWFDADAVEREPYMAPGLVGAEKAARGKRPTDVWFHTIVPTNGREKTGYPTQKPEGVLRRMVAASSRPGGWCLDPFAGSGTLGAVCRSLGRRFVLVDHNPAAIEVMRARLGSISVSRAPAARTAPPLGVRG